MITRFYRALQNISCFQHNCLIPGFQGILQSPAPTYHPAFTRGREWVASFSGFRLFAALIEFLQNLLFSQKTLGPLLFRVFDGLPHHHITLPPLAGDDWLR